MVKYSVDAIIAVLAPIDPIIGRLTFSTLWKLANSIYSALRKLKHPDYPDTGFAGYMMPAQAFTLFSTNAWNDPLAAGRFFVMPATAITTTKQENAKSAWESIHQLEENFNHL